MGIRPPRGHRPLGVVCGRGAGRDGAGSPRYFFLRLPRLDVRLLEDRLDVRLEAGRRDDRPLDERPEGRLPVDRLEERLDELADARVRGPRAGTFAPFSRASERPIAIACFRLFTLRWLRPLSSVPCCILRIALWTFSCAASP